MLPKEIRMALLVKWPVPLEDEVPVELRAIGKLVRADATSATLKVETLTFSTVDSEVRAFRNAGVSLAIKTRQQSDT
jgi:hypothetical protein